MQVHTTSLPGVLLLEPRRFEDERGYFMESYNQRGFDAGVGAPVTFVQDNHSRSDRGVLRGLHYQTAPHAQGKLVRVVRGRAFDVAVDLRRASPTFGQWYGVMLDAVAHQQLWIPAGFAHGFLALEDDTHFLYKTTDFYARDCERAIAWNDASLAIAWPDVGSAPRLAEKDAAAPSFAQADTF